MFYIFLTVITSVFLLIVFKLFVKFNVNTFVAIIINYFVAALTGIIALNVKLSFNIFYENKWLLFCIPLGVIFIIVFYLISITTQKINVSIASMANKLSFVMPVLYSVFILKNTFNVFKICSILLAIAAIYLATKSVNAVNNHTKFYYLPLMVFVGSGLIDVFINGINATYIKNENHQALFTIGTFFTAFCIGFIVILIRLFKNWNETKENTFKMNNLIGGIALGVPNFFSIYFTFKCLSESEFSSAQLFPILNLCNVVLATTCGYLFFTEKLSKTNFVGMVLAITSIFLILI